MIGKFIECAGTVVGGVVGAFTKVVGFASAYASEIFGGNEKTKKASLTMTDKIGNVLCETGHKAGELGSKAWNMTTEAVTGVTSAITTGVNDVLEDEEKSEKVKKAGIAMGVAGITLFAIGATMYCATKKNRE